MILAEKKHINQLNKNEEFEPYSKIEEKDKWKINLVKEISDVRFETLEVENFSLEELI